MRLFELPAEATPAVEVRTCHLVATLAPSGALMVVEVSLRGPAAELVSWRSFWPADSLSEDLTPIREVLSFADRLCGR